MWECTNISHHDKNIYKEGIFLNSEGTCHPLSPVIYENLRGNDEVNFGRKKTRIVGNLDLAYRNNGLT